MQREQEFNDSIEQARKIVGKERKLTEVTKYEHSTS